MKLKEKAENDRMYRAGIYCRISVEEQKNQPNESICSQLRMAEDFLEGEQCAEQTAVYQDEGVSGSRFDRKGFQNMLQDVENGRINMVIVKDFSRLGRDHIMAGYYIEKYFPLRGIRLVSILDRYDSEEETDAELLPFVMLQNEWYLRDISARITAAVCCARMRGVYVCAEIPYGYRKEDDGDDGKCVVPDPQTAAIVKGIFQAYLNGNSMAEIAETLNRQKICGKRVYKQTVLRVACGRRTGKGLWYPAAVRDILDNPFYAGLIVLRKTERPGRKLAKRQKIPRELWEYYPGRHEPLVTVWEFEQVCRLRAAKRKGRKPKEGGAVHGTVSNGGLLQIIERGS